MNVGPVILRELRVQSRRSAWSRGLLPAILFLVAVFQSIGFSSTRFGGALLFSQMVWWLMIYCLTACLWTTCDALSRERREGTLELVLMTRLGTLDVLIGKLFATAGQSLCYLVGALPVLTLPFVMGGVTPEQVMRVTAVLFAILWVSLALGLFASAHSTDQRKTIGWTLGGLFIVGILLPQMLSALEFQMNLSAGELLQWLPHALLVTARDVGPQAGSLAGPLVAYLAIGLVLVFEAAYSLNRVTASEESAREEGGRRTGRLEAWYRHLRGRRFRWSRRARMRWLLEANPYAWLSGRSLSSEAVAALVMLCWLLLALALMAVDRSGRYRTVLLLFQVPFWGWFLLSLLVALQAGARLAEDRRSGALELLLTAGLTPRGIIRGELATLALVYRFPVLLLAGMSILTHFVFALDLFPTDLNIPTVSIVINLASQLVQFVDVFGIGLVAMWVSFRTASMIKGALTAATLFLVLPQVVIQLFVALGIFQWRWSFLIPLSFRLILAAVLMAWAWRSLHRRFWEVVAAPVGSTLKVVDSPAP